MSIIYGGISAGKVVAQNIYFGIDGSGNTIDTDGIIAVLNAVQVLSSGSLTTGNLVVNGDFNLLEDLDVSGNLDVTGQLTVNNGVIINGNQLLANNGATINNGLSVLYDIATFGSGASVSGAVFTANAGASVNGTLDVSGNATFREGTFNSALVANAGASVNGTLNVSGNTVVNLFQVNGTGAFLNGVNFSNVGISENLFVNNGVYSNGTFVVGDGVRGNGVCLDVSGTTLNIFGQTQDLSGTPFQINTNVYGTLGLVDSSRVNITTFQTVYDEVAGSIPNIDYQINKVEAVGLTVPTQKVPVKINGVVYWLLLGAYP
jgi:hypothetical protein